MTTSTGRLNMKDAMSKTTDAHFYEHWHNDNKDAMSKTTDSLIYKNWQNDNERCNEQDN